MKKNHVWVIEMLDRNGKWCPTVGVALVRDRNYISASAESELERWRKSVSGTKFRFRKYEAVEK
jgi:hypothetical protein